MRRRHGVFDVSVRPLGRPGERCPYVKRPIPLPASVTHYFAMQDRFPLPPMSVMSRLVIGLAFVALPGLAAAEPSARLVHCGSDTCLRLSGNRADPAATVRIAGRVIPVEGAKAWRATLPLTAARDIVDRSGQTMTITLTDPRTGIEQSEAAMLPPGALGKPVELASLTVYAH